MPAHDLDDGRDSVAIPPIVDQPGWEAAVAELQAREKAATRELDAIAAARRRLPMVELPDCTLEGADGPVRLGTCSRASGSSSSTTTCGSPARRGSAPVAPGSPASTPDWSSWTPTTPA